MAFGGWSIDKEVYQCIRKLLPDGKTILEFGSGDGTRKLLRHYKMISIEHDKEFIGKYHDDYIYAPLKEIKPHKHFGGHNIWYDADAIKKGLIGKEYDFILIDGPPGANTTRQGLFKYRDIFNWSKPVIFDDTQQPEMWRLLVLMCRYKLKNHVAVTLNLTNYRKCFTVIHPDKEELKKLW